MPDKQEKERRKEIMNELRKKADEEFESSLPMSSDLFKKLFDHLDEELSDKDCDNSLQLTERFLISNNLANIDLIINWIEEHGGGCDCEVLANIEDSFED